MKKIGIIFLLAVFLLVGCSNGGEKQEETVEKQEETAEIQEPAEEVEAEEVEKVEETLAEDPAAKAVKEKIEAARINVKSAEMGISLTVGDGTQKTTDITIDGKLIYETPEVLSALYSKMEDRISGATQEMYYDKDKGVAWNKTGDAAWEKMEGQTPNIGTSYFPAIDGFLNSWTFYTMTEENGEYVFRYSGPDNGVIEQIKPLFSISVEGTPKENYSIDIVYRFNSNDYTLKQVSHKINVNRDGKTGILEGVLSISNINGFTTVEVEGIPAE